MRLLRSRPLPLEAHVNVPVDNARVRTRVRRASSMTCRLYDTGSESATGSEIQTTVCTRLRVEGVVIVRHIPRKRAGVFFVRGRC